MTMLSQIVASMPGIEQTIVLLSPILYQNLTTQRSFFLINNLCILNNIFVLNKCKYVYIFKTSSFFK